MLDATTTTILHVEDNAIGRYAIGRLLRRAGFTVVEAENGTEALSLARENPDLILLDINMPDMDGFEVCRRLKEDPETRLIPVLHLSATCISSDQHVVGLEGGADAFLVEPVDPALLMATIKALLRVRQAHEAERDAARQWQNAFDALVGHGIGLIDGTGRLLRCNRALADMVGRTKEELAGQPLDTAVLDLANLFPSAAPAPEAAQGHVSIGDRSFHVRVDPLAPAGDDAPGAVIVFTEIGRPDKGGAGDALQGTVPAGGGTVQPVDPSSVPEDRGSP